MTNMSSNNTDHRPQQYRKKPVVIEAVQLTFENYEKVQAWCGAVGHPTQTSLGIETLEGTMLANVGDYVIQGVEGEFYPCKASVFEKTYEQVSPRRDLPPREPVSLERLLGPPASDSETTDLL